MSSLIPHRILVNSLPKSGTNMVQKCLALAGIPYSGRSVAASSNFGRHALIKSLLRQARPNEVPVPIGLEIPVSVSAKWLRGYLHGAQGYVSGHAAFSPYYTHILESGGYRTIQVVRNPCAVLASWANYVVEPGYYWHEAHVSLSKLSPQERVHFMLNGGSLSENGQYYSGFKQVWRHVQGWVDSDQVLTVRYEDLVGEQGGGSAEHQFETIGKIFNFIGVSLSDGQVAGIANSLYGGTHTFRQGSIEGWRKVVDPDLETEVFDALSEFPSIRSLGYSPGEQRGF